MIDELPVRYNPVMLKRDERLSIEALLDIPANQMRGHNAKSPRNEAKRIQQSLVDYFNGVGAVGWQNRQL